mgnify:CR=1 FL=1
MAVETTSLRAEATVLLQELLRVDTVNPPGNETRAAEHLRAYLEENGVACELYAKVPERANLVARIPDGPTVARQGFAEGSAARMRHDVHSTGWIRLLRRKRRVGLDPGWIP